MECERLLKIIMYFVRCDNGVVVLKKKKKSILDMGEIISENCFKIL